jgi:hypothetical protein
MTLEFQPQSTPLLTPRLVATKAVGALVMGGSSRLVGHVLLVTGYRVDVSKYPFLSRTLLAGIEIVDGCLVLGPAFESSTPKLYFFGAPAVWSYGPPFRFVAGVDFAARTLARAVVNLPVVANEPLFTKSLSALQAIIPPRQSGKMEKDRLVA